MQHGHKIKNKPDKAAATLLRARSPRQITREQEEVWWLSPRSLSARCFTEKKSHLLVFDSASCEKKVFSPTERWIEKCSVATHTQLGRISAPNIWALGPLKNCGVLSPRLQIRRGWKRSNGGEPLHRAGLWSVSKEFCFFFYPGQRAPLLRAQGEKRSATFRRFSIRNWD